MKRNLLYILISLCVAFASCEDFLDVRPQTQVPADDFYAKENGYEDALSGCYIKMTSSNLYGRFLSMSGIDYMAQYYNKMGSSSEEMAYKRFDYGNDVVEAKFKSIYNELYNIVLQANDIIENIDSEKGKEVIKSGTKRDIIKGEALAIRAFCHFDLLRIFGQLPQNATVMVSLPYSEVTGVEDRPLYAYDNYIEKVEKDLKDALQLLESDPVKKYSIEALSGEEIEITEDMLKETPELKDDMYLYRRFRFNYYAVKALMARFYLYTGNTRNAYTAATEIINAKDNNGNAAIDLAGESDLSKGYFTLPSETLMALSFSQLENMTSTLNSMFKYGAATDDPMQITEERKNELFQGRNTGGNNRYNVLWGKYTTITGISLPYLKKYFQNEVALKDEDYKLPCRWQIPVLRLSEIYLIAMECSNSLEEVNSMFYKYMVARNEQPAPFESLEAAKEEILNEYRREFIAEGQMFFTYKRLGTTKMMWNVAEVSEQNYIVPVPASEKR